MCGAILREGWSAQRRSRKWCQCLRRRRRHHPSVNVRCGADQHQREAEGSQSTSHRFQRATRNWVPSAALILRYCPFCGCAFGYRKLCCLACGLCHTTCVGKKNRSVPRAPSFPSSVSRARPAARRLLLLLLLLVASARPSLSISWLLIFADGGRGIASLLLFEPPSSYPAHSSRSLV